ncbi:MAG: hypothetical protein WCP08_16495 [Prolixibacteraceae bacterium]
MRKSKNLRILLWMIMAGILIGMASVYYVFNMPHRDLSKESATFSLQASQLISEFKSDENLATTKYLDKAISVTGEIKGIRKLENHSMVFSLEDAMEGVSCTVDSAQTIQYESRLLELKIGTKASFKGRCSGMLMDVQVINCVPE